MPQRIAIILLAVTFSLSPPIAGEEAVSTSGGQVVERLDFLFLDLRDASCTGRCHVNNFSYRNDIEGEVFQHATHSPIQHVPGGPWVNDPVVDQPSSAGLHCVDCHEDTKVNQEGHGRLTIGKEDCLRCHHVDNKEDSCTRCHTDIDARPMEYQGEPFVHGFTADSDINCRECHLADPESSMKEDINCNKCHHTGPGINCLGCHEKSLTTAYYPRPVEINHLGWTGAFLHTQHPQARLSCQECHPPREDRAKGLGEYQAHCGQCHHKDKSDCQKCHQAVSHFFKGEPLLKGVNPIPDKMSKVLKCEDCHKFLEGGKGFSEVSEECARCHNGHYAELLESQRGVVLKWIDKLRRSQTPSPLPLLWREGDSNIYEGIYGEETVSEPGLLEIVEHYGLHNFSYSKRILSFLEKDSQDMGLESAD